MLTPNDVRRRKFRTYRSLLHGEVYDVEDVDDFSGRGGGHHSCPGY